MSPHTVAVVPLRSPGTGKTRLALALAPEQRAALAGAMLADVVEALRGGGVDEVVVAAGGPAASAAAAALGVEVVMDPPGPADLDSALRAAVSPYLHAAQLLVAAADLPQLSAEDVARLLAVPGAVVIAPTGDGGTGGLLRRPPSVIGTAYGAGSASRHQHLAASAGATCTTVELTGFLGDVDTWTDLVALHDVPLGPRTAAVLPSLLGRRAEVG
jgi:2-phospho-L-lactate/phosphoenolpyruvate guanylyltransferase